MPAIQQQLGQYRADQRQKQVPLRVPDIALRGEKLIGIRADQQRRPSFDQFVKRADRQADADHQEKQDFAAADG